MTKSNLIESQKNSTRNTRWIVEKDHEMKVKKSNSSYYQENINPKAWKKL